MIRRLVTAATALALCTLGVAASADDTEMTRGEAKLAKMLAGRVAGQPQRCVNLYGNQSLTSIDGTALVYKSGGTVWVNRTRNPESIDSDDVAVIKRWGTGLCSTDTITMLDRGSMMMSGIVFLDEFVPYRKAS